MALLLRIFTLYNPNEIISHHFPFLIPPSVSVPPSCLSIKIPPTLRLHYFHSSLISIFQVSGLLIFVVFSFEQSGSLSEIFPWKYSQFSGLCFWRSICFSTQHQHADLYVAENSVDLYNCSATLKTHIIMLNLYLALHVFKAFCNYWLVISHNIQANSVDRSGKY